MSKGFESNSSNSWEPDWALWDRLMQPPLSPFYGKYYSKEKLVFELIHHTARLQKIDRDISKLLKERNQTVHKLKCVSETKAGRHEVEKEFKEMVVFQATCPLNVFSKVIVPNFVSLSPNNLSKGYFIGDNPVQRLCKKGLLRRCGRLLRFFLGFVQCEGYAGCIKYSYNFGQLIARENVSGNILKIHSILEGEVVVKEQLRMFIDIYYEYQLVRDVFIKRKDPVPIYTREQAWALVNMSLEDKVFEGARNHVVSLLV